MQGLARELLRLMEKLDCRAGKTQIGKILAHVKHEATILPVSPGRH
jgi:hypothetical protein